MFFLVVFFQLLQGGVAIISEGVVVEVGTVGVGEEDSNIGDSPPATTSYLIIHYHPCANKSAIFNINNNVVNKCV